MSPDDLTKTIHSLKPNAEFAFQNADYSTVEWHKIDGEPPSFEEIEEAYRRLESNEQKKNAEAAAAKAALLAKLGITEDEAKLLLS